MNSPIDSLNLYSQITGDGMSTEAIQQLVRIDSLLKKTLLGNRYGASTLSGVLEILIKIESGVSGVQKFKITLEELQINHDEWVYTQLFERLNSLILGVTYQKYRLDSGDVYRLSEITDFLSMKKDSLHGYQSPESK